MTTNHMTFTEVQAVRGRLGAATTTPLEDLVERLRGVRLKVGRWLPSSDTLAAWRIDYAEVYQAATRLDAAVQALDAHLGENAFNCDAAAAHSLTLQMLLCDVEERAAEFEETVIENLATAN